MASFSYFYVVPFDLRLLIIIYLYMSIIKYGFNRQLSLLSTYICYKAFGIRIQNHSPSENYPSPTLTPSTSSSLPLFFSYKSLIALSLYNHYRSQNFRFTDKGTTPKSLAEQMQIFINKNKDINWQIDQFGNFIFTPTSHYKNKISQFMRKQGKYQHQDIGNGSGITDLIMRGSNKDKHVFWYYLHQAIDVSQIRKIVQVESRARIFENVNKFEVVRNVVVPDYEKCSKQIITRVTNIVFGNSKFQIQTLSQLFLNSKQKPPQNTYNYIGCSNSDTVYMQKNLPFHTLFNNFVGYQPLLLQKISDKKLKQTLNKSPSGLVYKKDCKRVKNILNNLVENQLLWIYYGNLIDQGKIRQIEEIIQIGKQMDCNVKVEIQKLDKQFRNMFRLYFQ